MVTVHIVGVTRRTVHTQRDPTESTWEVREFREGEVTERVGEELR